MTAPTTAPTSPPLSAWILVGLSGRQLLVPTVQSGTSAHQWTAWYQTPPAAGGEDSSFIDNRISQDKSQFYTALSAPVLSTLGTCPRHGNYHSFWTMRRTGHKAYLGFRGGK